MTWTRGRLWHRYTHPLLNVGRARQKFTVVTTATTGLFVRERVPPGNRYSRLRKLLRHDLIVSAARARTCTHSYNGHVHAHVPVWPVCNRRAYQRHVHVQALEREKEKERVSSCSQYVHVCVCVVHVCMCVYYVRVREDKKKLVGM